MEFEDKFQQYLDALNADQRNIVEPDSGPDLSFSEEITVYFGKRIFHCANDEKLLGEEDAPLPMHLILKPHDAHLIICDRIVSVFREAEEQRLRVALLNGLKRVMPEVPISADDISVCFYNPDNEYERDQDPRFNPEAQL